MLFPSNEFLISHEIVNINIHKLDAAFDIDPLFHKMSKTFDEGGAKGLLLANLGVGTSGCNIVFDSTLDNDDTNRSAPEVTAPRDSNSVIEVSSLTGKFQSLLSDASEGNASIANMRLVPQLSSLRNQYADLGNDGFVDEVGLSVRMGKKVTVVCQANISQFISPLSHIFCDVFSQNAMQVAQKMRLMPTNPSI